MPPTVKMNAVIEKTAKFIAEHGAQMEIVLKAKQAGNSQFDFLDYKSKLNSYYKFMVDLIKTGKYIPKTEVTENQEAPENTDHHEHGYLHKSLDTTKVEPTKSIKMPSVSIHDTPYGQLVKSIKKHHKEEASSSTSLQQQPVAPNKVQKTSIDNSHADDFQDCQYDFSLTANVPAPPGTEPVDLPFEQKELYGETKGPVKSFSEGVPPIIPPPPDVQPIIDRMAMYVAKNGNEFEIVVKSKNDTRFRFLNDWHVHFPYYHFRKMMHLEEIIKVKKEKEEGHAALMNRGVSFSIKTRLKDPEAVAPLKKPFFDYGSSDDEGEFDSQNDVSFTQSPLHDASDKTESNQDSNTGYISGDASDDIEDKKLAEDRLMNRLATVAREKLAQTSKEKQMQAERKRKAAMFISLLKGKQEHNTEETEKKLPIVFDYGHKSLDSKSKSPQCYSRSSSPPLSYSKLRRSLSRSPSRKGVNSYANTSTFRKQQSKHQTNITYNPPKCTQSPKLSRSRSRSRHRSPRSGNSIRKSSRSRRDVGISKRSLSKQFNSTEYQQERKSKKKPLNEGKCVNLPLNEHVTIKQEKFDPSFEESVIHDNIFSSKDDTNTNIIFSNTKEATNELTDTKNEVIDARDELNLSEHKSVGDDDDDVEIIEVPPKSIEPECLVDLTQIESDSDDDKFRSLKMENLKREQNCSRSTVGRKRYRRSKSPRSRQSTSPYYRSKSSPSCSPKRRRYSHSKSSKRRRSRSRSPKHRKHHSRSPKHRRSRSVKTRKSRSASLSKKHKSPNRKRSRTPKTKKRKNRSPSRSPKQNKKKIKDIEREGVMSETLPDFVKSIKDETEERLRQLESEGTENTKLSKASAKTSREVPEYKSASTPPKNLLHKVRAMLKASRDVLRNNEDTR